MDLTLDRLVHSAVEIIPKVEGGGSPVRDTTMKLDVARWLTREAVVRRARSDPQAPPAIR